LNYCRYYTQQMLHSLSRLIAHTAHTRVFSIAVVDSVLVILGRSLLTCAPESGPQLTSLVVFSIRTDFICFFLLLSSVSVDLGGNTFSRVQFPLLSFWPNNTCVASDVTMGFSLQQSNSDSLFIIGYQGYSSFINHFRRTVTLLPPSNSVTVYNNSFLLRAVLAMCSC
jgi:hypothetical protein